MGNTSNTEHDEYTPIDTPAIAGIFESGKDTYHYVDLFDPDSFLGSRLIEFYGDSFVVK